MSEITPDQVRNCPHGIPPAFEWEWVSAGIHSAYDDVIPGRWSFHYDECPTSHECDRAEAERLLALAAEVSDR